MIFFDGSVIKVTTFFQSYCISCLVRLLRIRSHKKLHLFSIFKIFVLYTPVCSPPPSCISPTRLFPCLHPLVFNPHSRFLPCLHPPFSSLFACLHPRLEPPPPHITPLSHYPPPHCQFTTTAIRPLLWG